MGLGTTGSTTLYRSGWIKTRWHLISGGYGRQANLDAVARRSRAFVSRRIREETPSRFGRYSAAGRAFRVTGEAIDNVLDAHSARGRSVRVLLDPRYAVRWRLTIGSGLGPFDMGDRASTTADRTRRGQCLGIGSAGVDGIRGPPGRSGAVLPGGHSNRSVGIGLDGYRGVRAGHRNPLRPYGRRPTGSFRFHDRLPRSSDRQLHG